MSLSLLGLASLLGVVALPRPVRAQSRAITLDDFTHLVRVSDPQISPDGRSIAVVVARANLEDNRYDTELLLVDIATKTIRSLTFERPGLRQPRWSPGGERLAFLAAESNNPDAKRQLWVLPLAGGDARRITSTPLGVQQFAWGPRGDSIAYVTADTLLKGKGAERHNDSFEVGDNELSAKAAQTSSHIWLVSATGGVPRRLTSGSWSLPTTPPPSSPPFALSWSPDGKSLAYVRQERPPFGDADSAQIEVLDVAAGSSRRLTGGSTFERMPAFSPDGSQIAHWYPRGGDPLNVNEIHVAPAAGGRGRSVTAPIDRNLMRSEWMPAGDALLVGGNDGTTTGVWVQPLAGPARRLDLGGVVPNSPFWVDLDVGVGGAIAFVGSEPDRPSEVYFMTGPDAAPERLTDFNGALAAREYGRVERFEWQGPNGFRQDGVLHFPPGYDSARRYPLVLVVHGGPRSASKTGYSILAHLMAARGWIVFEPNYRGSDNRGNAFQRAIFNDAGDGPGRDVMSGLAALKKRGFVDPSRVAVSGWSYGGYMTTWLLSHYSGWKAGVAGAAVTDMIDQYDLSDFNVISRYRFGGSPWTEGREKAYRDQSPITYANRIRTPTLILSNTGDARVPITQSYKLFHALRDNGVTTQFIAYPIPGHFPEDPVRTRDVYRRWIEWLDGYLQPGAGPQDVTSTSRTP